MYNAYTLSWSAGVSVDETVVVVITMMMVRMHASVCIIVSNSECVSMCTNALFSCLLLFLITDRALTVKTENSTVKTESFQKTIRYMTLKLDFLPRSCWQREYTTHPKHTHTRTYTHTVLIMAQLKPGRLNNLVAVVNKVNKEGGPTKKAVTADTPAPWYMQCMLFFLSLHHHSAHQITIITIVIIITIITIVTIV